MDVGQIMTVALASGALALVWGACTRILRSFVLPVFVVAPLAAGIPWQKDFPAVGHAFTLFASVAILCAWLYAQKGGAKRLRAGFLVALACVVMKPDMLLLVLAGVLVEGWRRRETLPAGVTLKAAGLLVVAAAVAVKTYSIFFTGVPIVSPGPVLALAGRLASGVAWNARQWIFLGSGSPRTSWLAATAGGYFYVPLLVPLAALAWRYRDEWWFVPTCAWSAAVVLLTLVGGGGALPAGCPPMQAALIIPTSIAALKSIGCDLRRSGFRERG